jgi:hypothetical protein
MPPSAKPEHFEGAAHGSSEPRLAGPHQPPGVRKQNARCIAALLAEAARETTAEQDSTGIYAVSSDEEAHRHVKLYSVQLLGGEFLKTRRH